MFYEWPSVVVSEIAEYRFTNSVVVGVVVAVLTNWFNARRQKKEKGRDDQKAVFTTLCSTREQPLNAKHVEALNVVPIVFSEVPAVLASYRACMLHFEGRSGVDGAQEWHYEERRRLETLLVDMAKHLGYKAAREDLERARSPRIHRDIENLQLEVLIRTHDTLQLVRQALGSGVLDVRILSDVQQVPSVKPPTEVPPQMPHDTKAANAGSSL